MGTDFISPSVVSPTSYVLTSWTIGQILTQAFRLAGGLKLPGQLPSPSEQQEALDVLNHWIDGCKLENLLVQFIIRTVFSVEIGKGTYSVGPGQDWDIERPEKLFGAMFLIQKDTTSEAELPMFLATSYQQYQQLLAKKVTSTIPLFLYYQATTGAVAGGQGGPYGSATIWPIPTVASIGEGGAYVVLYTPGTMQEFLTWDDAVITPKGYREMIMYNVAVALHERPPYNKLPLAPRVIARAESTKDRVMAQQVMPVLAYPDQAVLDRPRNGTWGRPRAWTPY